MLSLADARAALAEGNAARGNEAALQANRLAPTLIPAAALAARVAGREGAPSARRRRILTTAWAANPHPDLAAAFAAIEPDETPAARRKRFATLTAAAPGTAESRLLEAELALAAEDFPAARKALGDLAETQPTTRSLALMAAIERGQGAPDAVVRGWLAKALGASRGPQWICGKCTHVHAAWAPVCENCGAFDTLDWKTPTHAEDAGLAEFGDAAADRRRRRGRRAGARARARAAHAAARTSRTPNSPRARARLASERINPMLCRLCHHSAAWGGAGEVPRVSGDRARSVRYSFARASSACRRRCPVGSIRSRSCRTASSSTPTRSTGAARPRTLVLITLADAATFNEVLRALGHARSEAFIRAGAVRLLEILGPGTAIYHVSILSFVFRPARQRRARPAGDHRPHRRGLPRADPGATTSRSTPGSASG